MKKAAIAIAIFGDFHSCAGEINSSIFSDHMFALPSNRRPLHTRIILIFKLNAQWWNEVSWMNKRPLRRWHIHLLNFLRFIKYVPRVCDHFNLFLWWLYYTRQYFSELVMLLLVLVSCSISPLIESRECWYKTFFWLMGRVCWTMFRSNFPSDNFIITLSLSFSLLSYPPEMTLLSLLVFATHPVDGCNV